ncbi:DUF4145 domain-containing protein [Catenovulum sp. 2E275]|uniref:DUF4145 domain-containing protein n=1 Tax=Catenovulum sp. 2E275 TaxID=2980497 RepID=UPI0021CEA81B|nr:DUF4145 domain-containing protein [Catenovulum sp. 2E275]MCU4677753.1 DUF4145 domain-containing protein [Catenovulum sp. 2E275]
MQKVSLSSVKKWHWLSNQFYLPSSVKINCSHCSEMVVFKLESSFNDAPRTAFYFTGACPSCDENVHFFCMGVKKKSDESQDPDALFMYPEISFIRRTKDYRNYIPEQLQTSYESALTSYNSKNFIATSVGCRRTLEGIFYYLLPEGDRKKNLATAIEQAKGAIDWAEPLNNLAHLIRKGGNLGAHFDETREPNENVARAMIDLLEYLFEYLYELPANIKHLENHLEQA